MFHLRENKGQMGREQKETMQPCLHGEVSVQLLGGCWDLLSRMDVMGAPLVKPTVILMQGLAFILILSDSLAHMVSEAFLVKLLLTRAGKTCFT